MKLTTMECEWQDFCPDIDTNRKRKTRTCSVYSLKLYYFVARSSTSTLLIPFRWQDMRLFCLAIKSVYRMSKRENGQCNNNTKPTHTYTLASFICRLFPLLFPCLSSFSSFLESDYPIVLLLPLFCHQSLSSFNSFCPFLHQKRIRVELCRYGTATHTHEAYKKSLSIWYIPCDILRSGIASLYDDLWSQSIDTQYFPNAHPSIEWYEANETSIPLRMEQKRKRPTTSTTVVGKAVVK